MDNVKKYTWKIIIIIIFTILVLSLSNTHEHWSDEAQSFLLARDNSITELFYYMKYEGTPPLWVIIIKIFILLGGTYSTFYILPIIFSVIGLIIFEFKINAPWYIKVLFPFTYFIFYQYTIVVRSYCLVFPLLMIIACIYDKRFDKPILYAIILFIFMNISLHTIVISGSLYLLFLIDIFNKKMYKNTKIKIACVLIFLELLLTSICTLPYSDCSFRPNNKTKIWHVISEITIGSSFVPWCEIIITIAILIILLKSGIKHEYKEYIRFLILFGPVSLIYLILTYQVWHVGILALLLFVYFIINNKINTNVFIKLLFCCIFIFQINWTISSCDYDFYNNYSASKNVANFIKKNGYEDKVIYGLGYGVTSIQPYFNKNIFTNYNTDKAFYFWKFNNGYMKKELYDFKANVYIIQNLYKKTYINLIQDLEKRDDYTKYEFYGATYIKNYIYEDGGYVVYIKNEQ